MLLGRPLLERILLENKLCDKPQPEYKTLSPGVITLVAACLMGEFFGHTAGILNICWACPSTVYLGLSASFVLGFEGIDSPLVTISCEDTS